MTSARDTATRPADDGPLAAQSTPAVSNDAPLFDMRGIVKRFGATLALNTVSFDVCAGEIHALLGENGAGKSTLMHVASGLTAPDAGEMRLAGQSVRVPSPRAARAHGIAMVHQHFTLVPAFTVEENLALDHLPAPGERYSTTHASERALRRAEQLGWTLDPKARVADLPVGTQQRVEIVKALGTEAKLLIFDEPTAVLAGGEVEELFTVLRRLRDQGCGVILIAHKLAEILAVADRVTVLRRGQFVATTDVASTNAMQLAQWMVGVSQPQVAEGHAAPTSLPEPLSATTQTKAPPILRAEKLVVRGDRGEEALRGLSLQIAPGEIVGIGGVDGNGQTELAETLVGLRKPESGTLLWGEQRFVPGANPHLGYIPQDRRRAGLATTLSIEENLLFDAVRAPRYHWGPLLQRRALRELADTLVREFDIRTDSATLPASSLSGGNQQKIVVARALYDKPDWIVAVNPTRGLDIGATQFVHQQLREARKRGAAILVLSTDLDELAALADRAAILSHGVLTDYDMHSHDTTQLGLLLGGVSGRA